MDQTDVLSSNYVTANSVDAFGPIAFGVIALEGSTALDPVGQLKTIRVKGIYIKYGTDGVGTWVKITDGLNGPTKFELDIDTSALSLNYSGWGSYLWLPGEGIKFNNTPYLASGSRANTVSGTVRLIYG